MVKANRGLLMVALLLSICGGLDGARRQETKEIRYHYNSQQQWNVAMAALTEEHFRGDEVILDVGCGTGRITANIAGRVPYGNVTGIDLCKRMVAYAEQSYSSLYGNLRYIPGDALALDAEEQYDWICSFNTLHWISAQEELFVRIYSALKPGGAILFTMPGPAEAAVNAAIMGVALQTPWQQYLCGYKSPRRRCDAEEYCQMLQQAGFTDIVIHEIPFSYHFATKKDFIDWFSAFSPLMAQIPKARQADFLSDLVESYLRAYPIGKDGFIPFQQKEFIIKAQKNS